MRLFLVYFVILNILFSISAMAEKPYHHVYENGKFKNSEIMKARLKETKILNGLTKNLERQRKISM